MERPRSDEQYVIGANHSVARIDGRSLDDWQNIPLHALARHIGTMPGFATSYLIDFVDEDDAHLLGSLDRHTRDLIHVQQLVLFFLNQVLERIGDGHFSFLLLLAKKPAEHVF